MIGGSVILGFMGLARNVQTVFILRCLLGGLLLGLRRGFRARSGRGIRGELRVGRLQAWQSLAVVPQGRHVSR